MELDQPVGDGRLPPPDGMGFGAFLSFIIAALLIAAFCNL